MHRLLFLSIFALLYVSSCTTSSEDNVVDENPNLSTFFFLKANNPQLDKDVSCSISGDSIYAFIPSIESTASLVATFTGGFDKVEVGGAKQESGKTSNDYNECLEYVVSNSKGGQRTYKVFIR